MAELKRVKKEEEPATYTTKRAHNQVTVSISNITNHQIWG